MLVKTLLFLSWFLFFPGSAISQTFPTLSSTLLKKSYRIQWDSRYFQSHATINSKGFERPFEPGQGFTRWDNDIMLAYGFNDRFEPGMGLRYRFNNSEQTGFSSNGMESIWFQVKYRIPLSSRFHLTPTARFRQTLYSENDTNHDIVLGDPGNEYEWGGNLTWFANSKTSLSIHLGHRQPPDQLSQEIYYLLELFWQKRNRGLSLGVDGIISLQMDPYIMESSRKSAKKKLTGGTYLYNSFNRQSFKPYAALHYRLSPRWTVSLGASQNMQVLSGDRGLEISLNLSRSSKGISHTKKKIGKFKEYFIESNVTQVSKKQLFIRINQGLTADISKGMKFDIYQMGFTGDNTLIASGIAWKVGLNKSIIRIFKRYTDKKIQRGMVARGY